VKTEPLDDVEDHPTEDPLPKIVKLESEPDEGFSPPEKKQKTTSALKDLFGDVFITKVEPGESLFERVDSKINLYRTEPNIALDSDPLLWWKVNENKFHLLSKVAKKYLVVQATSLASERVFSTAGDVVTSQRACLSEEHVDTLIFLKMNLPKFNIT
jgi:hypothetical protein